MLTNIPQMVKSHFVELFKLSLKNNQEVQFERLIHQTLYNLQIESYDNREIEKLKVWFDNIYHLKFLDMYCETIFQEIILHSESLGQIIYPNQEKKSFEISIESEYWELIFDVLVLKNQLDFNYTNPFNSCDFKIGLQKYRLTLIHYSITSNNRSKIFLRKSVKNTFKINNYLKDDSLSSLFADLYSNKKNVIIAGSTGSGKTSFLECFINEQKTEEHIIVLEDTPELKISNPQTTYLVSRNENNKRLKDYCAYSMRLSPDRIVLGEMRAEEIISYVLLMNTGHNGMLSTIHANSSKDAISRMCLLFSLYSQSDQIKNEDIMKLLTQNIDYVVYLKNKEVVEIIQILGCQGNLPIYDVIYNSSNI